MKNPRFKVDSQNMTKLYTHLEDLAKWKQITPSIVLKLKCMKPGENIEHANLRITRVF